MELGKIIKYLEKKFPVKGASDWDHPGLQIYHSNHSWQLNREVNKVLVCLDLTQKSFAQALSENIDLIITRHPFIFEELKREKKNPAKKVMLEKLKEQNILVYAIHTNYDASPNQILPTLLDQQFNLKNYQRIGIDKEGFKVKLKSQIKLSTLKEQFQQLFQTNETQTSLVWDDHHQTNEFYLVTGSGGQTMNDEQLKDCVFITGELKWNSWIYANDNQIQALSLGHYMENYFVDHVQKMLVNAFNQLIVIPFDIQKQYN